MTDTKIENLGLSSMTYNALKNAGITDLAQLANMYEWQIENIRTIGRQTMTVIRVYMDRFNIHFKEDEEEEVPETPKPVSPTMLENVKLSPRSYNALKRHGIDDLQELSEMELCEFKRIRNLGETSMKEVMLCMCKHNVYFKGCTKEEMNSYKFWDNVCKEKKREQESPGMYLDMTDKARKSKALREAAKAGAVEEKPVEVLDEESFWEACSRELSDLIMAGYTIEDVCDELSITPSTFDLINQLAPIRKTTRDILKELKLIDKIIETIPSAKPSTDSDKINQLELITAFMGDYSLRTAETWTPKEDSVLKYLIDRGLRSTLIQLIIPRTKSSIQQRMSKVHDIENITYNPKGFPGVQCNYSKTKSISNDVKVGKYSMNNIGELLENLVDAINKSAEEGKSIDDIAEEYNIHRDWVKMLLDKVDSYEDTVLEVIKNDKNFSIETKNDLSKITGISVPRLNIICANLLRANKLSIATLWKRELIPSSYGECHEHEQQIIDWCRQGVTKDLIGYMIKMNPSGFRKYLSILTHKNNLPVYNELPNIRKRGAGRNIRFLQLMTLIDYHSKDLCKGLDAESTEIVLKNIKKLRDELVEPVTPDSEEVTETAEVETSEPCNEEERSFDDDFSMDAFEDSDEEDVADEPTEKFNDIIDEHVEKFVDLINESVSEAVKDPVDITEYHGLVEHEDTDEIEEPKIERPSYLRRKDEWTDHELEILKSMTLNGDTPYEISRHPDMHRSLGAIRLRIDKLRANGELPKVVKKEKPKKQKKTKEKKDTYSAWTTTEETKLIQMHLAGSKVSDIAKALRRTKGSVGVRIHKLRSEGRLPQGDPEITSRFKPVWTDEEIETIKRMIKEGARVKDILPHLPNKNRTQVDNKIADMRRTGKL